MSNKLYKTDFKYKKYRNLDYDKYKTHEEFGQYVAANMDGLSFRFNECKKDNCISLDLSHMSLKYIPSIPIDIKSKVQQLYLSENELEDLGDLSEFTSLQVLDCCTNKLKNLNNSKLPNNIIEFMCKYNELEDIDKILECKKLQRLDCSNNQIKNMQKLCNHDEIRILICSHNDIESIPFMSNLNKLTCNHNKIKHIASCPNLEHLECNHNLLEQLDYFPSLKFLFCNNNKIKSIDLCHDKLEALHIHMNNLLKIPFYQNLKELFCDYDPNLLISKKYKISDHEVSKDNVLVFIFET